MPEQTTPPFSSRTWSQRQRYAFIENRLYWEGELTRAALMERFGISAPQASDDIAKYLELAPGSVEYDRGRKAFVPTQHFHPLVSTPDARQYLTQLLLLADDAIASSDSWLGVAPMHAVMPRVRRRLDTETLRPIVSAIKRRRAIEVRYQSMSTPEPILRSIAPHALVYDGARWHVRGWCFNRSRFTDFVLARILKIGEDRASSIDPSVDREWEEFFTIELAPHPDLSESQRQAIEMDYGMENGVIGIRMRLCMTWYFERHYGLDIPAGSPRRRGDRSSFEIVRNSRSFVGLATPQIVDAQSSRCAAPIYGRPRELPQEEPAWNRARRPKPCKLAPHRDFGRLRGGEDQVTTGVLDPHYTLNSE